MAQESIFSSNRNGDFEIFSMNTEGMDLKQITNDKPDNYQPVQSPVGRRRENRIAFITDVGSFHYHLYTIKPDGSNVEQLTMFKKGTVDTPSWSPDGKRIIFATNKDGNGEVYSIKLKGKEVTNLTVNSANDLAPVISPVK